MVAGTEKGRSDEYRSPRGRVYLRQGEIQGSQGASGVGDLPLRIVPQGLRRTISRMAHLTFRWVLLRLRCPSKGKVSHATDCAPEALRHDSQWQIADPRGSLATLYLTLPQIHPPSRGSVLIASPFLGTRDHSSSAAPGSRRLLYFVWESSTVERSWNLRVALCVPCYVDQINPEVGVSVVRVLR